MKVRCKWSLKTEHEKLYHDTEWGKPIHNDSLLFEFITLEGAQAGLSWSTILAKREGYKKAFDNFDIKKIALYDDEKLISLATNNEIIKNKLKIKSTKTNAQAALKIINEYGSLDKYLWGFVNYKPIINHWKDHSEIPATSKVSDTMSKDLKKRGFKFFGSTICYAFMQATGMINDHTIDCFKHPINN